jgi:hypothetical protein
MLLVDHPSSSSPILVPTHSTHHDHNLLFPAAREYFEGSGSSIFSLSGDVLMRDQCPTVSLGADSNGQQSRLPPRVASMIIIDRQVLIEV